MMMDITAHPQHIYVVKDFVYVLSGVEKNCKLVWGLNQCTIVSFLTKVRLGCSAVFETLDQGVWW